MALTKTLIIVSLLLIPSIVFSNVKSLKNYLRGKDPKKNYKLILKMPEKKLIKSIKALTKSQGINKNQKAIARIQNLLSKLEEDVESDAVLDQIDLANAHFSSRLEYLEKRKKNLRGYASIEYFNWQDSYSVTDQTTSVETNLKSINRGPCIGGGAEYGSAIWSISAGGCLGFVSVFSNTQTETNLSSQYISVFLDGNYYMSDRTKISLGPSIIYRMADFSFPASSNSGDMMDGTSYFNFGASLKYHFELSSSFHLYSGLGGLINSGTLLWQNGLKFVF